MKLLFNDLSGGINTSDTKLNLSLQTKKVFSSEAINVELFSDFGIKRQNGNSLIISLPSIDDVTQSVTSLFFVQHFLLITSSLGNIYSFNLSSNNLSLLFQNQHGDSSYSFANFLNGTIIVNGVDNPLFFNPSSNSVQQLSLTSSNGTSIKGESVAVFKSRLFISQDNVLFFSALGSYNDFSSSDDAGFINNFHVDSTKIISLISYKDYLAIYKPNKTYLLSGTSPDDFSISLFADKGSSSHKGLTTVNNRQYFISNGLFALSQSGELNQIVLSDNIAHNISSVFNSLNQNYIDSIIMLPYEKKNQIWCFLPVHNSKYINNVFIFDYYNKSWVQRVIPFNITAACSSPSNIYTADSMGNVYIEDYGASFNGVPISFSWKTQFFSLGHPNLFKSIEEFFLILDSSSENKFIFSTFKNYDELFEDDYEAVFLTDLNNMIWDDDSSSWDSNDSSSIQYHNSWSNIFETDYKLEISESVKSVQLAFKGDSLSHDLAIVGIDFRELLYD